MDLKNEEIAELKKQLEAERRKYLVEIKPFEKNPWDQIEDLKRHNLALVEQIQTQHKQIDQLQTQCAALQTCTESLDKDEHEIPPGKVIVDGVEWYRLGLKVRRLDEDFGARLKLLENAHTSLVSSIRRCVETINDVEF